MTEGTQQQAQMICRVSFVLVLLLAKGMIPLFLFTSLSNLSIVIPNTGQIKCIRNGQRWRQVHDDLTSFKFGELMTYRMTCWDATLTTLPNGWFFGNRKSTLYYIYTGSAQPREGASSLPTCWSQRLPSTGRTRVWKAALGVIDCF